MSLTFYSFLMSAGISLLGHGADVLGNECDGTVGARGPLPAAEAMSGGVEDSCGGSQGQGEGRGQAKAEEPVLTLAEARRGFRTTIAVTPNGFPPLPEPPSDLFVRMDYINAQSLSLPAYVTPDPKDGKKHPAILWLRGGDTSSLTDFWSPRPPSNDQTAAPFRHAGVVMMFPTLRGGNTNPGRKEYFFGEVDDVLAAARHLARLPYVDPQRIYLGGHSTGGTLALLATEMSGQFKATFALGPVAVVDRYPVSVIPVDFRLFGDGELRLRSPVHWLDGISTPTYVIEGKKDPGNIRDLERLCGATRNPLLHCIAMDGADHFSVLAKATPLLAAGVALIAYDSEFALPPNPFPSPRH